MAGRCALQQFSELEITTATQVVNQVLSSGPRIRIGLTKYRGEDRSNVFPPTMNAPVLGVAGNINVEVSLGLIRPRHLLARRSLPNLLQRLLRRLPNTFIGILLSDVLQVGQEARIAAILPQEESSHHT